MPRATLPLRSAVHARRLAIALLGLAALPAGLRAGPPKTLFDFDGADAADAWVGSDGGRRMIVPGPAGPKDGPAGQALGLRAPTLGSVRTAANTAADWSAFSDLTFWVYRSPDVARKQPRTTFEVRLRDAADDALLWRKVEVTHTGWKQVALPLRWFRPWDNRVPGWGKVGQVVFFARDDVDLLIDTVQLRADRADGPRVGVDDLKDIGFAGLPGAAVRSVVGDDLWLLTNSPDLDLDGLAKHLRAVAARVQTELKLPPAPKGQPPCLLVFASRPQYQAFTLRLADRLNGDATPPASDGFTTFGVATSYFDPVAGQVRPVFTHEFVHSLLERALGWRAVGEWFHEGVATYYQVQFHPQASYQKGVKDSLPRLGGPTALREVCNGRPIAGERYWYAATLVELFLKTDPYRARMPDLIAALRRAGRSDLEPHLQTVFDTSWAEVERRWLAYCAETYGGAAPAKKPKP